MTSLHVCIRLTYNLKSCIYYIQIIKLAADAAVICQMLYIYNMFVFVFRCEAFFRARPRCANSNSRFASCGGGIWLMSVRISCFVRIIVCPSVRPCPCSVFCVVCPSHFQVRIPCFVCASKHRRRRSVEQVIQAHLDGRIRADVYNDENGLPQLYRTECR